MQAVLAVVEGHGQMQDCECRLKLSCRHAELCMPSAQCTCRLTNLRPSSDAQRTVHPQAVVGHTRCSPYIPPAAQCTCRLTFMARFWCSSPDPCVSCNLCAGGRPGQQGRVLLGPCPHGGVLCFLCSSAAAKRRRDPACGPGNQVLCHSGKLLKFFVLFKSYSGCCPPKHH